MTDAEATHFEHGSDIGIRGTGRSREDAFARAAAALAAIVVEPKSVSRAEVVSIACAAPDDRLLLYDWLNAVVFEMAVRRMVFGCFKVSLLGQTLEGRAWGEAMDPDRHKPALEPKGATMSGLKVEQAPDGTWIAECIIDV